MKFYISPSNQVGNKYNDGINNERDVCFDIGQRVAGMLNNMEGCSAVLGLKDAPMKDRCAESDKVGADYHICIHTNAGGGEGTRLFVHPKNKDLKVVKDLIASVGKCSIGVVDTVVTNTTFTEIAKPKAKTLYLELEFHDKYGKWISDHRNELAASIVEGLKNGLGLTSKVSTPVASGDVIYRVQVGAFKSKLNAVKLAAQLKENYRLDAIVVEGK